MEQEIQRIDAKVKQIEIISTHQKTKESLITIYADIDNYYNDNLNILIRFLTLDDFKSILEYVIETIDKKIINQKEIAILFRKDHGIKRTTSIFSSAKGDNFIIIEPKSKNALGQKQNKLIGLGAFKRIKYSLLVLSSGIKLMACCKQYFETKLDENLIQSLNEIQISQQFDSEFILKYKFAHQYKRNGNLCLISYCELMISDLHKYILDFNNTNVKKHIKVQGYKEIHQLINSYVNNTIDYISCLIEAVKIMHEHGFVHQDIKPHNILIRNTNSATLCDFNLSSKEHDAKNIPNTTSYYEAPEIFSLHRNLDTNKDTSWQNQMLAQMSQYSSYYAQNKSIASSVASENNYCQIETPKQASDLWSLGIVVLSIIIRNIPNSDIEWRTIVKQSPFLEYCLDPNYVERCSIQKAALLFSNDKEKGTLAHLIRASFEECDPSLKPKPAI